MQAAKAVSLIVAFDAVITAHDDDRLLAGRSAAIIWSCGT